MTFNHRFRIPIRPASSIKCLISPDGGQGAGGGEIESVSVHDLLMAGMHLDVWIPLAPARPPLPLEPQQPGTLRPQVHMTFELAETSEHDGDEGRRRAGGEGHTEASQRPGASKPPALPPAPSPPGPDLFPLATYLDNLPGTGGGFLPHAIAPAGACDPYARPATPGAWHAEAKMRQLHCGLLCSTASLSIHPFIGRRVNLTPV